MAEGLYGAMHTFSRECVKLCAELELEEDVSAWATIAAEHIRIARGEDDESYRLMQRCISQPWLYRQEMLKENSWVERTFKLAGAYVCGLF